MTVEKRPVPEEFFSDWKEREALAEAMIPLIGRLYRKSNVSLYMYGKRMINQRVTDLMKAHRYVRQVEGSELSLFETFPFVKAISELTLGPAHIDVGKIVHRYLKDGNNEDQGDEKKTKPPKRDLGKDTLAAVLDGDIFVNIHCYRADELAVMMDLAKEMGFTITAFHHTTEAYKVAALDAYNRMTF